MKKLFLLVIIITAFHASEVRALTLTGPTLTNDAIGWADTGLHITALKNVTLESFLFHNQRAADTISLYNDDATSLLETYNYAGGEASHLADVSWDLTSGESYKLLAHELNNGRWTAFRDPDFPVSNAHLRINSTIIKSQPTRLTGYWFNFTHLETIEFNQNNVIPEPSTMLLLGSGLFAAFMRRRKKG